MDLKEYRKRNPYYKLINMGLHETALFAYPEKTIQFFIRSGRLYQEEYSVAKELGLLN